MREGTDYGSQYYLQIASQNNVLLGSISTWFCIGSIGRFGQGDEHSYVETKEPDRSKCIKEWIVEVENMVTHF